MVTIVPDKNLNFTEYTPSLEQNPANIFYQRVQSRNISSTNCQFTVSSPNKRSYLLASAEIEWRLTLNRTDSAGGVPVATARNYDSDRDLVTLKPVLPMANCMSSITVSINGTTGTLAQPRRFQELMSMLCVTKEESVNNYEGMGFPDRMGGTANVDFPSIEWAYNEQDHSFMDGCYDFSNRQLRGDRISTDHNSFFGAAPALENGTLIIVNEPIIAPPFNPYSKVDRTKMKAWCPYKWMSDVIPNIDRVEIDIQMQKMAASILYYHYARSNNNQAVALNIASNAVSANLLFYWTEVPVSYNIPASVDIPSFTIREFQDSPTTDPSINDANVSTRSQLIQLNSVPSLFITHLEIDKDAVTYQALSGASQTARDDEDPAANVRTGGAVQNWDNFGEIDSIQYLLGDRPNVISVSFGQREIYEITRKNCKNLAYSFDDWRGRKRPVYGGGEFLNNAATTQAIQNFTVPWVTRPCKGFVAVTASDLANKTSTGVFSSNSIQIVVNWRPHSGFAGYLPGNMNYQLYNHLVYSKEFLRIETDKAQFQNQSLDEASARRLVDPPLGSMQPMGVVGGSIAVGGSLPVAGRSKLSALRNRGFNGVQSRVR